MTDQSAGSRCVVCRTAPQREFALTCAPCAKKVSREKEKAARLAKRGGKPFRDVTLPPEHRYKDKWAGTVWRVLGDGEAARILKRARLVARLSGHGWLADDIASHALIEAHRRDSVKAESIMVDFLREEFGREGTERNEFETASRLFACDALGMERVE